MTPLRIAHVGPVATAIPPRRSGSVQEMTSLLTEGLVSRGHDVTLFATGDSTTTANLHATFERGYWDDENMWPWELYEMLNLAAAIERAGNFDIVHYEATYYPVSLAFTNLTPVPVLQTVHHSPNASEIDLWARYPSALYVAISREQARVLSRVTVVGTVLHAVNTARFTFCESPDDYLLFVGRFTPGKGVLEAIQIARRLRIRLLMAGPDDPYFRETIAPHVDGDRVVYCGEVDFDAKVKLYGGARALLYPLQTGEPFGLVMAEAMACGTPVAALDRGAVREVVDDGLTGAVFDDVDQIVRQSDRVLGLDRRAVRRQAISRFGIDRMVDEYVTVYRRVIESHCDRHTR